MNAGILVDFCKRLIKSTGHKVSPVLDNLRISHAIVFKAWLLKQEDEIEILHLPSYSPELNPDDYLNCDLKAGVHRGKPARTKAQLEKNVVSHMRMLQRKSLLVAEYFEHERTRYPASQTEGISW